LMKEAIASVCRDKAVEGFLWKCHQVASRDDTSESQTVQGQEETCPLCHIELLVLLFNIIDFEPCRTSTSASPSFGTYCAIHVM
jgi:hypothetical protein